MRTLIFICMLFVTQGVLADNHLIVDMRSKTAFWGELTKFPDADALALGIDQTDVICVGNGVGKICIPVSSGRCYWNIPTYWHAQQMWQSLGYTSEVVDTNWPNAK